MEDLKKFVEENDLNKSAPICALFYWVSGLERKPGRIKQWRYLRKFKKLCSGEEHELWICFFCDEELKGVMRGLRNLDEDWKVTDEIDETVEKVVKKFGDNWKVILINS